MSEASGERSTAPPREPLRVGVVVPAAGAGRRMGGRRKPWLELGGRPILLHALSPFLERSDVVAVRVALASDDLEAVPGWLGNLDERVAVVAGGESRAGSVRRAIRALPDELDVIVVHDAARPLVTDAIVERCVVRAGAGTGAVAGWPATDTLKEVDPKGRVVGTPDRSRLWHAQTPQAFPAAVVREAYERLDDPEDVTDDASAVEKMGGGVVMVEGSPTNLKVTRPNDLPLAELYLELRAEADRAVGGGDPSPREEEDGG